MNRLLLSLLAVLICVPVLVVAEEKDPTWALGWADGTTLRHKILTNWELELSGGPNDYLTTESKWEWDENDPPSEQGIEQTPQDNKREQGWVRLGVGRTLVLDGRISLTATASLRYTWSHEQRRSHSIDFSYTGEVWRDQQVDWYQWDTTLGFRVSVAVLERLWLEADFGVVYEDLHYISNSEYIRLNDGDVHREISSSMTDGSDFSTFGWNGFSSLGVMVWF